MKVIEIRANGTKRVKTVNNEKTRTQQHMQDATDVNKIMERYKKTGTITHINNSIQGKYMDLTKLPSSYLDAINVVNHAQNTFESMPAKLKEKFQHNPQTLINWMADKKNEDEAIQLGLIAPRSKPAPPVPPTPPTTP